MYSENNSRILKNVFHANESPTIWLAGTEPHSFATDLVDPHASLSPPTGAHKARSSWRDPNSTWSSKKQTIPHAPVGPWTSSSSRGRFTSCESEKDRRWIRYRQAVGCVYEYWHVGERASLSVSGAHKGELQHKSCFVLRQAPDTRLFQNPQCKNY